MRYFRLPTLLRNLLMVGLAAALLPLAACSGNDEATPSDSRSESPDIAQPTESSPEQDQTSSTGRILFTSLRDGNAQIYVMNSDGSGQTRLTNSRFDELDPEWSPDASQIAFSSTRDGNLGEIYVMNADGSQQTRRTRTSGLLSYSRHPAWSPDGTTIAYTTQGGLLAGNDGLLTRVYTTIASADIVCDPAGNVLPETPQEIPNQETLSAYLNPAWSPDGSKMAFSQLGGVLFVGVLKIMVMDVDGTRLAELTDQVGEDQAAWSPDGSKVAYSGLHNPETWEIHVINADGSGEVRLTNNSADDLAPTWSPDGSQIAFQSDRDGRAEIYVMNADGTDVRRLTQAGGSNPDWAPALDTGRQSEDPLGVYPCPHDFEVLSSAPLETSEVYDFREGVFLFSVPDAQRDAALREVQAVVASGQQVLDCGYGPTDPEKNVGYVSYGFWYDDVPDNIVELLSLAPQSGAPSTAAHLGTNARTSCPESLGLAERAWEAGRAP